MKKEKLALLLVGTGLVAAPAVLSDSANAFASDEITATAAASADAQYTTYYNNAESNTFGGELKVKNTTGKPLDLSTLDLQYAYDASEGTELEFVCDYSGISKGTYQNFSDFVTGSFTSGGENGNVLHINFTDGVIYPDEEVEIKFRVHTKDWTSRNQSDDYGFNHGFVVSGSYSGITKPGGTDVTPETPSKPSEDNNQTVKPEQPSKPSEDNNQTVKPEQPSKPSEDNNQTVKPEQPSEPSEDNNQTVKPEQPSEPSEDNNQTVKPEQPSEPSEDNNQTVKPEQPVTPPAEDNTTVKPDKPTDTTVTNPANSDLFKIHEGDATFYGGGYKGGNCLLDSMLESRKIDGTGKKIYICAMNHDDYLSGLQGAYIRVMGPKGDLDVLVSDQLPEGKPGDVDMAEDAFPFIADPVDGRVKVKWQIIPYPTELPVQFVFKGGSTQFWMGVQVRNHRYPIQKFEYLKDGQWVEVAKNPCNYYEIQTPGAGPYTFRITDMAGHQLIQEVPLTTPGEVVNGTENFPY